MRKTKKKQNKVLKNNQENRKDSENIVPEINTLSDDHCNQEKNYSVDNSNENSYSSKTSNRSIKDVNSLLADEELVENEKTLRYSR